jgi:cytochrome P450
VIPASDGRRFAMPADTSIILATILMHRNPAVWGPDALDFKPDRWRDMGPEREAFMAWNIGPRMARCTSRFFEYTIHRLMKQCLGQPFALTVVHTFLVLLFRHLHTASPKISDVKICLATESQPLEDRVPLDWDIIGDGRGRQGRDKVGVVADVVLAVKVSPAYHHASRFTDDG